MFGLSGRKKEVQQRWICRGKPAEGVANAVDIHVGSRIKQLRKEKKMSQEKLAEKLGVTFQQLQKYENGQTRVAASRLFDISIVLGVTPNYFFDKMPKGKLINSPRIIAKKHKARIGK